MKDAHSVEILIRPTAVDHDPNSGTPGIFPADSSTT
jgi:hypothetical protein